MGVARTRFRFSAMKLFATGALSVAATVVTLNQLSAAGEAVADPDPVVEEILAINADADYGEYLAGECMTCHSVTKPDSNIPAIHGKDAPFLIEALIRYRDKTRENETMRSVAGALGNEEIAALAAFFSQQ